MGYHSGMLVARAPWAALEAALRTHAKIDVGPEVTSLRNLARDVNLGGEHDGRAYVYDAQMLLSANGDLVAALSRDVGALVVGCGAETVSGSWWLFAAERGELLRAFSACAMDLDEPFAEGAWPAGASIELADLDGVGIRTVLERAGFDFDAFMRRGMKRVVTLGDELEPISGAIGARIDAHRASHAIPEGERPQLRLVVRTPE
jgi:hypothetical protein